MKRTVLSVLGALLFSGAVFGQVQGDGGMPNSRKFNFSKGIDKVTLSEPNIAELRAEDAIVDAYKTGPWRFGFNNEVDFNLTNSGTWSNLPNGGKVWNLVVKCENALTINLTLKDMEIEEGNAFYAFNPSKTFILGKFTEKHLYKGTLGTELIPGEEAVLEYYVAPGNDVADAALTVSRITHGYRTADEFMEKAFGSSGSCNMNVNCPDGASWENQKRGALMLVSGSNGFCSGSMINNTLNDGTPYVLTANHCYSDPTNWIFRFNWESATCDNPGSSPSFESLSGAVLRSRRTPSDMCLVEITGGLENGTVPAAINTYFSGWNNSNTPPTSTVSIHHPAGDIKKISFDDDASFAVQAMGSSEANSSWEVQWDRNTTTEGGSSGSPLFDQDHRIIGQLWGGGASCSNLTAPDWYGRVHNSWEPAGSDQTNQLKHWLDPNGTGVTVIDGYDPSGPAAGLDAGASTLEGVSGTLCIGSVTPQFTLINLGTDQLTSATITYGYDGVEDQTYNWTGTLDQYASEVITFPTEVLAGGSYSFSLTVTNPNGGTDENNLNDGTSSTFTIIADAQTVTVDLYLDCYGSETSWEIVDAGDNVLFSGSGYVDDQEGLVQTEVCLAEGCYNFKIYDSYGDGLAGATEWDCTNDGYYEIVDENMTVIGELPVADANFGSEDVREFCITGSDAGLNETDFAQLKMYPNPTDDQFVVNAKDLTISLVEVTSMTGQVVISKAGNGSAVTVSTSSLNAGVYMTRIHTNKGVAVKALIVK